MKGCVPALVATVMAAWPAAAEPLTFSGPAMGTTYRVTLAAPLAGMAVGTMHREVERLLASIDRAASTWRQDSDARRFNRAAAGEWVEIGPDLDQYRVASSLVRIRVVWLSIGTIVVEIGSDESRLSMLELQVQEQELDVREALQQRMRDLDRERIARDLHDSVIQQLFATVLDLQSASGRDPAVQDEAINRAVESIDEAMTSLRRTIYDIGHEQRESFEQRLRDVVGSFGAAPFTIDLQTELGVDLPDDLAEDVSMVVLEALANVARHAHAARCQVRVAIDGRWLLVTVTDDGVGPPAEYSRMSGLMNMTERARLQGGWCWLRPGSKRIGSRLTWSVPLPY